MGSGANSNRKSKFFKDFGIYTIGIFGTRVITFLMIPLYTYFVEEPSNYGIWDLCLQTTIFLLPLATLQMREAAFRFLYEEDEEKKQAKIISFIFKALTSNLVVIGLVTALLFAIWGFKYTWLTFLLLLSSSFHDVMCQVSRGLKRNDIYVSCNILNAVFVAALSVLFVAVLKMDVVGIFWANIISRVAICVYLQLRLNIITKYFRFHINCGTIGREILKYSLPLIPTSMCWLVTTVSDRFFIKLFVSDEMNGIYAAAVRYTMILHSLALVFYQTWQETAIKQYHTPDRDELFSKVFNCYVYSLGLLLIVYSYTLKFCYTWLVGPNYQQGADYLFVMGFVFLLGAISSSFFDLGYQCAKDTKRAIPAIILAAIVNVAMNVTVTPALGVYGVITSNFVTYLFLGVYRYFDTRRYFKIAISPSACVMTLLLIVGASVYAMDSSFQAHLVALALLLTMAVVAAPKELKKLVSNFILKLIK